MVNLSKCGNRGEIPNVPLTAAQKRSLTLKFQSRGDSKNDPLINVGLTGH